MTANRNFYRKQFSSYLGENRAILDIHSGYFSGGTPSPSATPTLTPTNTPTQTPGGATATPTPTPTITPSPSTPPIYETEYQAILNRATALGYTLPGTAQKIKQNQLVIDLKTAGLWSKLGTLYIFNVDTSDLTSPGFTFINWITPNVGLSSIEAVGVGSLPTHTSKSGWTFSDLNRLRIGTNVGLSSVNAVSIAAATVGNTEGLYMAEFTAQSNSGTNMIYQTDNNGWNRAYYNTTSSHTIFRNVALTTTYNFTGTGFKAATIDGRIDVDTTIVFRNGGVSTPQTKAAVDTGVGGGSMLLNGTTNNQYFSWTCSAWFSGVNLDSTVEVPALEAIIDSYMTS